MRMQSEWAKTSQNHAILSGLDHFNAHIKAMNQQYIST